MRAWIDSLDFPEAWIDLRRRRDRVARRTVASPASLPSAGQSGFEIAYQSAIAAYAVPWLS
jgi:hypothetical protein